MPKSDPPGGQTADPSPSGHYLVLARKYRPRTFDDLIGQDAMVKTLANAFKTGRIAQAYMLTGVRGVGKTTTARILARALNYEPAEGAPDTAPSGPTIDLSVPGEHCEAIMASRHPDVLEMDAASNTGIDNVREIIENARYKPVSARTKVFIIDEVHMLSRGAFNALLKTLEEPPEHVKFIFATTEIRKVPVTVLSRCQRFDLRRVDSATLIDHFAKIVDAEGAQADADALALVARASEGSVRDGLSILDQALAIASGNVTAAAVRDMLGLADRGRTLDLLETTFTGDAAGALAQAAALFKDGADPLQLIADLAEAAHMLTRARVAGAEAAGDTLSTDERTRAGALAERLTIPRLNRAWQMLTSGHDAARRTPDVFAAAEMLLVRLAYTAELPTPDDLVRLAGATGADTANAGDATHAGGGAHAGATARANEAAARRQVSAATPPHPPASNDQGPVYRTFEEVVALIGERRDLALKYEVEEKIRLVRYEPGLIELELVPGSRSALAGDVKRRLDEWTDQTWTVIVAREGGGKTIAEQRADALAAERAHVADAPLLKAALAAFPGATIERIEPLDDDHEADGAPAERGQNASGPK
ncbi:MAG: DNA polymerase III subunit gamma/tau [Pseudomonadota bacterium]